MSTQQLIDSVCERVTSSRRKNFACTMLAPVVIMAILWLWALRYSSHSYLWIGISSLIVILLLVVFRKHLINLKRISILEAAQILDRQLTAKERFLTIATIAKVAQSGATESLDLVNQQATRLSAKFDVREGLPFSFAREAKISLYSTPPLLAIFFLLLWLSSNRADYLQSPEIAALSKDAAGDLRELVSKTPTLPSAWRDEMNNLADLIEDEGLLSDDVSDNVDDLLSEIDTSGSPLSQEQHTESSSSSDSLSQQSQQLSSSEESTTAQSSSSQGEQLNSSSSAAAQKNEPPAESEQKKNNESTKSKSDNGSPDSSGENGKGEKTPNKEGGQEGSENNQGDGSKKQSGQGNNPSPGDQKDDNKKDVTGLGEGKGSNGENSKKDLQGEGHQGGNENGAKDGQAKHDAQGGSSGASESTKNGASGETPNASKQAGSQSGKDKNKNSGSGGAGSDREKAKEITDKINSLKEKLKEQSAQSSPSESQEAKASGGDAQQAKQDQANEKGEKTGNGGKNKPENPESADQQGPSGKKDDQSSTGKKGKSPVDANQKDENGAAKDREEAQHAADERGKENENSGTDAIGGLNRSSNKNQPSTEAQRFGPFAGGDKGKIELGNTDRTKVGIPLEQKLEVRSLGGTDNKLYKNKPGASAQTALGPSDFKKPEAEVGQLSQPIPAEYQDLLH